MIRATILRMSAKWLTLDLAPGTKLINVGIRNEQKK